MVETVVEHDAARIGRRLAAGQDRRCAGNGFWFRYCPDGAGSSSSRSRQRAGDLNRPETGERLPLRLKPDTVRVFIRRRLRRDRIGTGDRINPSARIVTIRIGPARPFYETESCQDWDPAFAAAGRYCHIRHLSGKSSKASRLSADSTGSFIFTVDVGTSGISSNVNNRHFMRSAARHRIDRHHPTAPCAANRQVKAGLQFLRRPFRKDAGTASGSIRRRFTKVILKGYLLIARDVGT